MNSFSRFDGIPHNTRTLKTNLPSPLVKALEGSFVCALRNTRTLSSQNDVSHHRSAGYESRLLLFNRRKALERSSIEALVAQIEHLNQKKKKSIRNTRMCTCWKGLLIKSMSSHRKEKAFVNARESEISVAQESSFSTIKSLSQHTYQENLRILITGSDVKIMPIYSREGISLTSGVQELTSDVKLSSFDSSLCIFTYDDLRLATRNFCHDNVLGKGGFGTVYKGWIDDSGSIKVGTSFDTTVAVKILNQKGTQGHREWETEIKFLGQLYHPHLVKLIGYSCEGEHRLLVYEFMRNGSLESLLFNKSMLPLSWVNRMKIALGAAKGLAFLHGAEKPVIYRDFKTSNILVDSDFTAKLSDFGLAKDGPECDKTHVTTRVMGTYGYAAPEYIMTGHLTPQSDVYGFGVVLLELLTGKRAIDKSRPRKERNLIEWAMPFLHDKRKLLQVMDPRLDGIYSVKGVQKAAALTVCCISQNPKSRPSMEEVVQILDLVQNMKDMTLAVYT